MPGIIGAYIGLQEMAKQPYSLFGLIIGIATIVVLLVGIIILCLDMLKSEDQNGKK